jgi:hypothetical protein
MECVEAFDLYIQTRSENSAHDMEWEIGLATHN